MTHDAAVTNERIEVQRLIPAEPAAIFSVLTDPQGHVAIDSSGMLMSATGDPVTAEGDTFVDPANAVVGSGIIFAYTGFQGPLDFAGNVRRGGIGEAARLRWAVYGTIAGSIVLYVSLQIVCLAHLTQWQPLNPNSPYTGFAVVASVGYFGPLVKLDALLSPMGSGLVFTHALTRECVSEPRCSGT